MILDAIKPYIGLIKIASIAAAVIAAVWWWNGFIAAQQAIGYDRAMGEVATAQAKQAEARRLREAKKQAEMDEEARNGQTRIAELERRLAAARDDTERMRQQYREAAERGRRQVACAAGAGEGKPSSDPIGVLAGLLDRADRRAEEVAAYADRIRLAGESCERSFDAVVGRSE